MIYWNVYKNNYIGRFVYGDELTPMEPVCTFVTKYKTEKEAKEACEKLNKHADDMKNGLQKAVDFSSIPLREFYIKSGVGWRDEFEDWLGRYPKTKRGNFNFCYEDWVRNYTEFAKNDERVLWTPFTTAPIDFNFPVYRFKPDGFYEYIEYGMPDMDGHEDYEFVRAYKNREDARIFVKDHNKHLREQNKEKAEKDLTEKIAKQLIPNQALDATKDVEAPKLLVGLPKKTLDWKEAMKALIEGKRIEARVCIPGLPESENGWFEVEFAIGPEDKEFGESVKFGRDWDYRILDDSQEREELFEECEKLGIINVSKVSKVSTSLLRDIVDAINSINLDWDMIAKQINKETGVNY